VYLPESSKRLILVCVTSSKSLGNKVPGRLLQQYPPQSAQSSGLSYIKRKYAKLTYMTVMEITKKLIYKTIFEGEKDEGSNLIFDCDLNLKKHIPVNPGHDWGTDNIWQGSVGQDKKHKIYFSMPLWSGGIIEVDLKKGTWTVHS
jgi:hypothetical protein